MAIRAIKTLSLGALFAIIIVVSGVWAHSGGAGGYGPGYGMMHGSGMMGGYGMMHGPDMMGGYGTMHGPHMMGMDPVWMSNLTEDQRDKIGKLQAELGKKQWATMSQIMDQRQQLFELYSTDSPDANKIGAVYGEIFDLRRQMIEATIDVRNRTRALLTEEQRAKLDQWRHGWGAGFGDPRMMGQ